MAHQVGEQTSAADALTQLAKELRKGSGGASSSKEWNNGYLAGMEEAAKRAATAAAELSGPLTFQGIPLVIDETMEHGHVALYLISAEAAKAVIEAGHEFWLAKARKA